MNILSTATTLARWSRTPFVVTMLMLSVSSCAPMVVAPGPAIDCAGWTKISLYDETIDAMTDEEVRDIAAHNDYGRALGCWD